MGDRAGDSFRGWVYALGLCGGWGALGLLVCFGLRFLTCLSTLSLVLIRADQGVWGLGRRRVFPICRLSV